MVSLPKHPSTPTSDPLENYIVSAFLLLQYEGQTFLKPTKNESLHETLCKRVIIVEFEIESARMEPQGCG